MRRWGGQVLAAVSLPALLLCAASAALWVRSYFVPDEAYWTGHRVSADGYKWLDNRLISYRGQLVYRVSSQDYRPLPPGIAEQYAAEYRRRTAAGVNIHRPNLTPPFIMPAGGWWVRRGFSYSRFGGAMTPTIYNEQSQVTAPHWAVAAAAALLPAVTATRWWRNRRRARPGACAGCGYDLTGNVSGVCPECGLEAK